MPQRRTLQLLHLLSTPAGMHLQTSLLHTPKYCSNIFILSRYIGFLCLVIKNDQFRSNTLTMESVAEPVPAFAYTQIANSGSEFTKLSAFHHHHWGLKSTSTTSVPPF